MGCFARPDANLPFRKFFIKLATGRARPSDSPNDAHVFNPFTDPNSALPSGHVAMTFAWTTPWAFYYPHPITYGLVGLGVGTAAARLQQGKHWFTDVVSASAIAIAMSHWLYRRHTQSSSAISIEPRISFGSVALAVSCKI